MSERYSVRKLDNGWGIEMAGEIRWTEGPLPKGLAMRLCSCLNNEHAARLALEQQLQRALIAEAALEQERRRAEENAAKAAETQFKLDEALARLKAVRSMLAPHPVYWEPGAYQEAVARRDALLNPDTSEAKGDTNG